VKLLCIGGAGFRISAALGLFKYATLPQEKKFCNYLILKKLEQ
jgi:hypothetical protein